MDEYRSFLLEIARPALEIVPTSSTPSKGVSKFGGPPDLPADFEWPRHALGAYRFIGQFNLADIPKGPHGLPANGLLSFFYAHDEDAESFWGDPEYVRVYRFGNIGSLAPTEPPAVVRLGSSAAVGFRAGLDVPPWPCEEPAAATWPISGDHRDAYWELRCRLHPSHGYLLGYPFNTTLAYDPTPGPEWRSLLTLRSDDDLDWCWHDGDWLVTFVEEERLRASDFTQIRADAG